MSQMRQEPTLEARRLSGLSRKQTFFTVLMATSRGGCCIQRDQKMAKFGAQGRDRTTHTRIFSEDSFIDLPPQVPTLRTLNLLD